jgi:hypothetical protein
VAAAILPVGLANGGLPQPPLETKPVEHACAALQRGVQAAFNHAATTQVAVIPIRFRVVTPGRLTGEITSLGFGTRSIPVGHVRSLPGSAASCLGSWGGPGTQRARVISWVGRRFSHPGLYTVHFALNHVGRRLLAQLGAKERAYRQRYPQGDAPPTMWFGIVLTYVSPEARPPRASSTSSRTPNPVAPLSAKYGRRTS